MRALVTGGSSGIGASICARIVADGGTAISLDVNPPAAGAGAGFVACDVTQEAMVVAAVAEATERLGGLDRAFLNAGIGGVGAIMDLTAEAWDTMHAVDLRGVFLSLRESARAMLAGDGGSIVVTSSISGSLADRRMSHYNSAKAGANHFARIAAAELGPRGIRVNVIAPGTTQTPMAATTDETLPGYRAAVTARTPLGGFGDPDLVAEAAVGLSNMRWVTGQILAADGGVSLSSPIDVEDFLPAEAKPWMAVAGDVER